MKIRKAEEKDIPRLLALLEQVLQIHAKIRPDIFIPGTTKYTICAAEPIGPNNFLDIMVIAPCTGNTAAKLCNGITDTPVLMAAKAHMRNGKPLVISISTNDALGANFKNIGMLMNTKNVYFVPFGQDNCKSKPNSLVAKMELLPETIEYALNGRQIQPVIQNPN